MLSFSDPAVYQSSKCYFTHGTMGHLDPKQLPSRGKPWATIMSLDFIHKVDIILPQESYEAISQALVNGRPTPAFQKVTMPLGEVISGDFFKEYIKIGNVQMLSEGRVGADNVFKLSNGRLTMFLDKETYERAGLVGEPHGAKGNRGLRPRWVVNFDLRSPSMFPGKKGFDRLAYACKNVLNTPVTWLFCNLASTSPDPDPLAKHFPTKYTSKPGVTENLSVLIPNLKPDPSLVAEEQRDLYEDFATETYEWLALLRLRSPRVEPGDEIDPYLCRYRVPGESEQHQEARLCKLTWEGFLSPLWARETLINFMLALPRKSWFSFSATTFSEGMMAEGSECTFLRPPNSSGEYLMWEVKGHD